MHAWNLTLFIIDRSFDMLICTIDTEKVLLALRQTKEVIGFVVFVADDAQDGLL